MPTFAIDLIHLLLPKFDGNVEPEEFIAIAILNFPAGSQQGLELT